MLIYYHIPTYVTVYRCIFNVEASLILMDVPCRRNDVFLNVLSLLQHQYIMALRHSHCYSPLSCEDHYIVPVMCDRIPLFVLMVPSVRISSLCSCVYKPYTSNTLNIQETSYSVDLHLTVTNTQTVLSIYFLCVF